MKLTFERISEYSKEAREYNKNNDNKLSYANKKVLKQLDKIQEEVDELIEEARINHCSVDDKGNVLRNDKGGYEFTKDGIRNLTKDLKKIKLMEFEIKPYIAQVIPDDLTEEQIDAFVGIVITELVEEI